jgi:hypothetical protein
VATGKARPRDSNIICVLNSSFKLPAVDHVGDKRNNSILKQQLMASNINNGPKNVDRYLSENHAKFDGEYDPNCRGVLDPELVKDLRASHYQIGENGNFFPLNKNLTCTKIDRIEKQSEYFNKYYKNPHEAVKKENLCNVVPAFTLGNKSGDYRTMYRQNYVLKGN